MRRVGFGRVEPEILICGQKAGKENKKWKPWLCQQWELQSWLNLEYRRQRSADGCGGGYKLSWTSLLTRRFAGPSWASWNVPGGFWRLYRRAVHFSGQAREQAEEYGHSRPEWARRVHGFLHIRLWSYTPEEERNVRFTGRNFNCLWTLK